VIEIRLQQDAKISNSPTNISRFPNCRACILELNPAAPHPTQNQLGVRPPQTKQIAHGINRGTPCNGAARRWRRQGEEAEARGSPPGEAVEVDGVLQGRRRRHAPGEAVEALRRRRRAPGVIDVEDLKRTSGKILLSVERAARPDIYIGVRCTTHDH
jgi:hypothetical protein